MKTFSRRDFLKWTGGALASFFLTGWTQPGRAASGRLTGWQGRVLSATLPLHREPHPDSPVVYSYWRDLVFPITDVVVAETGHRHNRIWYRLGEEGYAYSGDVQPVRTEIQTPATEVPASGQLAEVTVPYTDARYDPEDETSTAYRLYYETTHWVDTVHTAADGTVWYRLWDDRFEVRYFALGRHLRLVAAEELAPLAPEVPRLLKKIEVRLSQQLVAAYEHSQLVFVSRAATGARFASGNYSTPQGWFLTFHKRPTRHMAAGDIASNGFDLPGVPWVTYITRSGISFHGTYWHNDYGAPRSHGCINLTPSAARWIYRWTQPVVPPERQLVYREGYGTYVHIIP